ncbi:MAG: EamA family transporter [Rhodospirillales bacterium]|nr:MAG: EamA family transporter [Rhodospirillales bacterium]
MEWLPLALLAAFSVATADALTKKGMQGVDGVEIVVVRFVFTGVLLAPLLAIQPLPAIPAAFWPWLAAMIPIEVAALWLYMIAIRDSPLALTLPYLAFTPAFATVTGWAVLGERVSVQGFAGILVVVFGAYVLNAAAVTAPGRGWRRWLRPLGAIVRERGSRLMLTVAALYSITIVLGKGALQHVPVTFFAPFFAVVLAVTVLVGFASVRPSLVRALWRRPGWHLAIGAALAVSLLSHLFALRLVEVAYMIAVKRTSLLFGILYGAVLFREAHLGRHLVGGTLMLAGVVLIALASA